MIDIRNEDCRITMRDYIKPHTIDIILTSPFYNTYRRASADYVSKHRPNIDSHRYDVFVEKDMTNEEYVEFMISIFNQFDTILAKDGVILFNLSYGAENTECMPITVSEIIKNTNFTMADLIAWKKSYALPVSKSKNKLTRLCEFIYVFCRRADFQTFRCSKKIVYQKDSYIQYEAKYPFINYIEAINNDEPCPYNKAAFSVELCKKLLNIYAGGRQIIKTSQSMTRLWEQEQQRLLAEIEVMIA